jgi:flagellar basal-body rod protein FlgF
MDATVYTTLSRQSGLMRELQVVAQNIANASTTGYRREGTVFAEHVAALGTAPSLSMAHATGRLIDPSQGALTRTGGALDMAVMGEGYFQVSTPDGLRLTRNGAFTLAPDGTLVTQDGHPLLDEAGASIVLPPDAGNVRLAEDGTLSLGDAPLGRVGVVMPEKPETLRRDAATLLAFDGSTAPVEGPKVLQGQIEEANVNAVSEISRMIEVQRAYEAGQTLLDREDDRIRTVIRTLAR